MGRQQGRIIPGDSRWYQVKQRNFSSPNINDQIRWYWCTLELFDILNFDKKWKPILFWIGAIQITWHSLYMWQLYHKLMFGCFIRSLREPGGRQVVKIVLKSCNFNPYLSVGNPIVPNKQHTIYSLSPMFVSLGGRQLGLDVSLHAWSLKRFRRILLIMHWFRFGKIFDYHIYVQR